MSFQRFKKLLTVFVFMTGAMIMVIEMAAARLLAPYFGNSLFVWANIIGVVMIALALGYYFGGQLADRWPQSQVLMFIVLAAGIFTALIPLLAKVLGSVWLTLGSYQGSLIINAFLANVILFAVPILLLGFVSPFSIRLAAREVAETGNVSGSLYAFSTIGSIVGTFGAAFGAIP